jgi:hypothetical protein
MLEFTILDFILTASLCYMCGVGTGLVICCRWKDHIAIPPRGHNVKPSSSQNDLNNFAAPPAVAPQFSATATAMPSAPAMKITYE